MNGINTIVFTAGIGENQASTRKKICEHLEWLGVKIDDDKNNVAGEERRISSSDSKIQVWVVPTNEELVIARDTLALIK